MKKSARRNAEPLISVGVTCYNAEATIGRAVESALAQDWQQLEVIVIDDASSDRSVEIVNAIANRDPRVKLFVNDRNQGCATGRNRILTEAQGEAIIFFDDDDFSHPSRIKLQWEHILRHEQGAGTSLIACYASGRRIYPNGYEIPIEAIGSRLIAPHGTVLADYLLCNVRPDNVFFGSGTPTNSLMARQLVFERVGGFDTKLRRQEDADFAIRLAFLGGHFIGTTEPVLTQFATEGTDKCAAREYESFLAILDKNRSYLEQIGCYYYMRNWAHLRYCHFSGRRVPGIVALLRLLIRYPVRTSRHFIRSATNRYLHERKMRG